MRYVLTVALALLCSDLAAAEFYVAPDGNDAGIGTEADPFATLERSRDALRQLRAADKIAGPDGTYEHAVPVPGITKPYGPTA